MSSIAMTHDDSWFNARFSDDVVLSIKTEEKLYSSQSGFQKIEVFKTGAFGRMLVLDDIINVTERDEFIYHEMMTHVPMFTHPDPQRVMVVGGGDGGVVRELMKHAVVQHAFLVEIDPEVISVSREFFNSTGTCLDDPRVSIINEDASNYIKNTLNNFDVIIVDSTDPIGAGESLFGSDFYKNCYDALTDTGILTAQSESPFFDPDIVSSLYAKAREIFPIVKMYIAFMPSYVSGIWSFLFASKKHDPLEDFQTERFAEKNVFTHYYNADIHSAAFSLPTFIKKQFAV